MPTHHSRRGSKTFYISNGSGCWFEVIGIVGYDTMASWMCYHLYWAPIFNMSKLRAHQDPGGGLLLKVRPTPGYVCHETHRPCESFTGNYCHRMHTLACLLEHTYHGKTITLFSHAASVAIVAALLQCSLRDMKFAPCGVYHMERRECTTTTSSSTPTTTTTTTTINTDESPYESRYGVVIAIPTMSRRTVTQPIRGAMIMMKYTLMSDYFGRLEGIDLDYFIATATAVENKKHYDSSEHKSSEL